MALRFSDIVFLEQNSPTITDRQDFAVRKRRPIWQSLLIMFLGVLVTSIALSTLVEDTFIFAQVLFILLVSFGTYVILTIQSARDLVLTTEFQNALFSSALSHSNKFCIIVQHDNNIAYIDHSLQEMFPNFYKESRRGIDVLLEMGRVSIEDRKIIFESLERRKRDKIIFDITDYKKQQRRIIMSIEPISRPKGFMLMRGHEYVEKRVLGPGALTDGKSPVFNETNIGMFSYIMDSMDIGAYIIDLFGQITYANLTLEQWLNFDANELTSSHLSIKDIISKTRVDIDVEDIKNFEGEVVLQRKIGGSINAVINQRAMYGDQGTVISYAGFVYRSKDSDEMNNKTSKHGKDSW